MAGSATTYYFQQQVLDSLTAAMAVLDGAKIGLVQSPITPTHTLTLATVQAAPYLPTYDTYAVIAVAAWSLPYLDPLDGLVKVDGGDILFTMADGLVGNSIWGWYMEDAAGANLLLTYAYDLPTNLTAPPDAVLVDLAITVASLYGSL